jgi:DNA-binding GntR family transcriptional regulator
MARLEQPVNGFARVLLNSKSLKELVVDELRHAIATGRVRPGAQLKQDLLAAEFGVSRMPVREALQQLEAEGLVEFRRHRIAIVSALSADDIREIFEIRMLIECRAIELGVPNLTNSDLAKMARCHQKMCSMKQWRSEWAAFNKEFHSTVYCAAGRTHMVQLIASVQTKLDQYLSLYLNNKDTLRKSNAEHADILKACRRRDGSRAALLTQKHIEETMEALLTRLDGPRARSLANSPERSVILTASAPRRASK